MEQLNIEGKRSGDGFVCHRQRLAEALARATATKVELNGCTLGRKGFVNYLRHLSGGMIKVVPDKKALRVVCGSHRSNIADHSWVSEDELVSPSVELRITPYVSVAPNLGTTELAEALARVIPFAATDKERPVLSAVHFRQEGGILSLQGADGYRLAEQIINLSEGEGEALIPSTELKAVIAPLRKAKRVRLAFEGSDLVLETEAISYRWGSTEGGYPDLISLIPTEFKAMARFDAREALTAGQGVALLSGGDTVVVSITEGVLRFSSHDGEGETTVEAETEGEGMVAISGKYLAQTLKACGGMVEARGF